ncbi:hypothetical protein LTR66_015103 [Elasticomyces elasticus]|nr:hypothetical protein LTR66_015103 [Elasticomyces elasticus]
MIQLREEVIRKLVSFASQEDFGFDNEDMEGLLDEICTEKARTHTIYSTTPDVSITGAPRAPYDHVIRYRGWLVLPLQELVVDEESLSYR